MWIARVRILLLIGACALPLGAQATLHIFAAPLAGPSSTGNGFANLAFNDVTNSFNLYLTGVGLSSAITSAQFVSSATPAPPLPTLTTPASTQQAGGYAFDSFYFNMAGSPELLQALQTGAVSISLATVNFPAGEIGGDIGQVSPIPEPATWALAAVGLIAVAGSALRRRRPA